MVSVRVCVIGFIINTKPEVNAKSVCVCFRSVWVSPWWSVSGSDVKGFVFEASWPIVAGRALLHTSVEQVNTPHTRLWFYCRSERAVWWWLDVTVCVRSEKRIRYDHYLIPFTLYELGLLYKQQGDCVKAMRFIEDAKWVRFWNKWQRKAIIAILNATKSLK